ncbi:single-stranded DNA-binding protein [Clostridium sp. UBA6640]|uniref:single-stranded DNA-binding protein n=1 Tax=Clostridium sp. UBA6640 TaxID=1946370 RepID=UPI0025C0E6C0|nr:single-stranded DNA-binding protein [Clostridium sp. UBA6640]
MLFLSLFYLGGIIVLLYVAKSELINLKSGEIFLVRDLFKGYEWNRISRSDRLLLGTLFLNYIKNDDLSIVPIEKTSSGQQRYKTRDYIDNFQEDK